MTNQAVKYKIGCLFSRRKLSKFDIMGVENECFTVVILDPDLDLSLQNLGSFDAIIHRASDAVECADEKERVRRNLKLAENLKKIAHEKNILLVEPVEVLEFFSNRFECLKVVDGFDFFLAPKMVDIVKGSKSREILNLINDHLDKKTPFIVKTTNSLATENRYSMLLCFNTEEDTINAIEELCVNDDVLAQVFHNHSGVLYKIFTIGEEDFHLEARMSIDNVDWDVNKKVVKFFSNSISKTSSSSVLHAEEARNNLQQIRSDIYGHIKLEKKQIFNLVHFLIEKLNCGLLGIDIILSGNKFYVIDINYLPGYDGFENYKNVGDCLREFLYRKIEKFQKKK